ncbi:MAG: bifunctional serine/threonine-protein kinase/formylglycine-generating enzyme family protein [Planctomycetota bacterium]|jgi:dienelactone hydrolase
MSDLQRIKPIFSGALDKKGSDRESYLNEACGEDIDLRAKIEALLQAHAGAGDFLEAPILDPCATLDEPIVTEVPGNTIGRYKLLEKFGEGGMATVYLAEQSEPVHRKVALKIIKLGMDTKSVIARFEAERQALAMMDHPNIARIFDGGATDSGRPYFVMELVKGTSITEYCDKSNLNTRERLGLFIQICHAVQHAHQKGIIHRDLKPSNVMVALHDDKPVPKVIDFGIAKATDQRLTEKTFFTRQSQMIGTPAYMSPEQAGMSEQGVDTRTDIYSLGVLLYELLTGTTPFDAEKLRTASYLEMQRIICEEEPTRPSTKLNGLLGTLSQIAAHRQTTPESLGKQIRGDLDRIVMKALEKDRARRYQTAHALAEDIRRHTNNEPILAAPPGAIYLLRKYCRRHRSRIVAATAAVLLLLGATASLVRYFYGMNVRWARQEALPLTAKLARQGDYLAAFFLAEKAARYIPDDPTLAQLRSEVSRPYSVQTVPDGAEVYYKDYSNIEGEWLFLGVSPMEGIRFPRGAYRLRIRKKGFETREIAATDPFEITLQSKKDLPRMVPIDSPLCGSYLMDNYEVTNEQYKRFVEEGGYENKEYWKNRFVKNGQELSWDQAVREFCDKTGMSGPATWAQGTYQLEQANYPVSGVSWYEAAAYAEFIGKALPTTSHWYAAAATMDSALIIPHSNFGDDLVPVGEYRGIGRHGLHDMAGNVREWCWNSTDEVGSQKYILGGSWADPEYMFSLRNTCEPFDRSPRNGFRCVIYPNGKESLAKSLFDPVQSRFARDISSLSPLSDEEYTSYKKLYSYDRSDLDATTESVGNMFWHENVEKATFNAAYGGERVIVYLFLPTDGAAPYQPVIFVPSINAWREPSSQNLRDLWPVRRVVNHGRAVIYPVFKGTYERGQGRPDPNSTNVSHLTWSVQLYQDLARSIEYLETRSDIDTSKLAYVGLSWGAGIGPKMIALETRIRVAVLISGGCFVWSDSFPPGTDSARFAPKVTVPVMMINGVDDTFFPYHESQRPLFELLGTPIDNKVHRTYPGGHGASGSSGHKPGDDVIDWLDRYLGPPYAKQDAILSNDYDTELIE